ncbi:anti-sigma factor domain-containing protein [Clostridium sp. AL.422]|uniref:anti-sigma factor domain-containing protein n=1 Tax=Clostridium TaxID=1485 RepID=UPI00293DE38A|nr:MULTISPECIES: anti-sigma factor domain-containing protein [unclassified Clostridium]MDV4149318.1 anti-sigma factor domain-containing protein [Clostridium sp. AL.422]
MSINIFEYDKYKFSTKAPVNLALDDVVGKREEEIERLREELLSYKILIKDLIHNEPSYILRNKILNVSYFIIEDIELFDYLNTTKKFPINRLLKRTPIDKEFYQTWKEYIVAFVVILANPTYKYLQEYLQVEEAVYVPNSEEIIQINKEEEHRGIILHKGVGYAIILTSKGEFIKVKAGKDNKVGEDFVGKESFTFKKYKFQISIIASILVLISIIGIFQYRLVDKTIAIETTSLITIEVNKFNKIIDAYSRTEKGINMLDKLKIDNADIDNSIKEILNYCMDNEMIPETGIVINVTGNPLKYTALQRTEKFIEEQGLQVKLNNSGDEHKVSP